MAQHSSPDWLLIMMLVVIFITIPLAMYNTHKRYDRCIDSGGFIISGYGYMRRGFKCVDKPTNQEGEGDDG